MVQFGVPVPRDTRDRILDAGESVLLERGASATTLEAVADHAKVSKGGLLYHFPSKDALIRGMIERIVDSVDQALAAAYADPTPGAFIQAYVELTVPERPGDDMGTQRLNAALAAAVAIDPALLDPLRAAYARWQIRLEHDHLDPAQATLARLATDGWWLSVLIGLPPLDEARHQATRDALLRLTRPKP